MLPAAWTLASLGADSRHVGGLVLRQAAPMVIAGLAASAVVAACCKSLLLGVEPFATASYAAAALLLATVTFVAAWLPAPVAVGVDPARTLRAD